jgi:hypothetical protein
VKRSTDVPCETDGLFCVRLIERADKFDLLKRMIEMMYMTLTMMAGLITVMFVATAVSSVVNSVRETEAARRAAERHAAF